MQSNYAVTPSAILNAGNNNPLTMYLAQVNQQVQQQQQSQQHDAYTLAALQYQQQQLLTAQQNALYNMDRETEQQPQYAYNIPAHMQSNHAQSASISNAFSNLNLNGTSLNNHNTTTSRPPTTTSTTIGGLLAPRERAHSRAVSLPAFAQQAAQSESTTGLGLGFPSALLGSSNGITGTRGHQYQASFGGLSGLGGFGAGYGLGMDTGLSGWAEEENYV